MRITKPEILELVLDYGGTQRRNRGEVIHEIRECLKRGEIEKVKLCFWFLGFTPYMAEEVTKALQTRARTIQ